MNLVPRAKKVTIPANHGHGYYEEEYEESLFGFVNEKDEWVIPPQYPIVREFSCGYAYVETLNGYRGFINKNNDFVCEFSRHDGNIESFKYGICVFQNAYGYWNMMDTHFNILDGNFSDKNFIKISDTNKVCELIQNYGARAIVWADRSVIYLNENEQKLNGSLKLFLQTCDTKGLTKEQFVDFAKDEVKYLKDEIKKCKSIHLENNKPLNQYADVVDELVF